MNQQMKFLIGRINLVQEERFRLVSKTGKAYLLVLAYNSRVTAEDLREWHDSDRWVRVVFEGEPNFESGIAHRAEPIDQS
jgi:hypothetical protein